MAVTITTTYAGKDLKTIISAAVLSGATLSQNAVKILTGVKYKTPIKRLNSGDIVQDATCDFTPAGAVTFDEHVLEVKPLEVNLQICKTDFLSTWEADEMGASAWDNNPKAFQKALVAHVAAKVSATIERTMWQGDDSSSLPFNGFETILTNDTDVIPVTGDAAGVTPDNVLVEMGKTVDGATVEMRTQDGLTLYISRNVADAYIRALGGFGTAGVGANGVDARGAMWYGGQALSFDGIPVFIANGMSSDRMVLTMKDNLVFGTGILPDFTKVALIDQTPIDGSDNVNVIMKFTGGCQDGFGGDAVLYTKA